MSSSNIKSLPHEVNEYSKLNHEKRALNRRVAEINAELRGLDQVLIEKMSVEDLDAYEICPSRTEEKMYGGIGALQLKVRNEYDRLSHDNLIRFSIQFWQYVMPEGDDQAVTRLGYGIANWIWNNRGRTPKKWLDRIYLEDAEKKQKRKRPTPAASPAPKKARNIAPDNVPNTREEFLSIPDFQNLITSHQAE